jgi:hypothetical protein
MTQSSFEEAAPMTDALRALVAKWRNESTLPINYAHESVGKKKGMRTCADELEHALAAQAAPKPAGGDAELIAARIDKTRACRAAEKANARFGQWMPGRWLSLFIEAYNGEAE